MSHPVPPQVQVHLDRFRQALRAVEGRELDPLAAPWREIEGAVIKMLGGAFAPQRPEHRAVALMIAAALAMRLARDLGAFWFPHRGTLEGAALGFADAVVMLSPLEVTVQALARSQLVVLDRVTGDVREALARGQAAGAEAARPALGPEDYRRLFDPGLMQFVCLDRARAEALWRREPGEVARELEDAFRRLPADVPPEAARSIGTQLVRTLERLEAGRPLAEQPGDAVSLLEVLTLLYGATEQTALASAELWEGVLLPLLHVGAAQTFPPVEEEELEAFRSGADPLLVYVESVPYQVPAVAEDGLLGVFPPEEVRLLDACFGGTAAPRLLQLPDAPLAGVCARFDAAAVRAAVERFTEHLRAAAGARPEPGPGLLAVALPALEGLARTIREAAGAGRALCLRQATEAEASSAAVLDGVARVLQAPRIVLARG